jgi:hypothetical protein
MPNTRTFNRSFAGGELSPEMFGRIDDVKYQTGAAKISNMIATAQGPVVRRPGTKFVRGTKNNGVARLIPFTFNTTQTMVIEIGVDGASPYTGYIRFHTNGGTLLTDGGVAAGPSNAWSGATNYDQGATVSYGADWYYCIQYTDLFQPPTDPAYWYPMPAATTDIPDTELIPPDQTAAGASVLEIPHPYAAADLFAIHYVQSGDIVTLVHKNYAPRELKRVSSTTWTLNTISFAPALAAPNATGTGFSFGNTVVHISAVNAANPCTVTTASPHYYGNGDPVRILEVTGGSISVNGYWIAANTNVNPSLMNLRDPASGVLLSTAGSTPAYGVTSAVVTYATRGGSEGIWSYKVTAVDANGVQSLPSAYLDAEINLNVTGSFVTVQFEGVTGAASYNIYKKPGTGASANGSYGYIGNIPHDGSALYVFTDDNIAPDLGKTIPIQDTVFASAGNYPGAVSYYEQRRIFAGTTNEPQSLWMTRSNTESDMSYSIPTVDTDRIEIKVAAREANTIRHIVPLSQLVLLTQAAEWRVTSVNSDALTPTSISVRPQSYIGASDAQPVVVNNSMIYCADRGGHIRELGYSWQANGFTTGDLSLRANHLFDNYSIVDMAYAKAPLPLIWLTSSNGSMVCLTYVPDQQIGAWSQHQTDGTYESVCAVAEGTEDRPYMVVKRTINGSIVRYVEQMAAHEFASLNDAWFVDCGLSYDGTNTTAFTVTLSGGVTWGPEDLLTLTSSSPIFAYPATTDVGDAIILTDPGNPDVQYRLRVMQTTSTTVAKVKTDLVIASTARSAATSVWAWARDSVSGLTHLNGKTVSILADGCVHPQKVVTGGVVTLDRAAKYVVVGLPYNSDLQTLPLAMNIEGFGQGRYKNVNKAWLRVYRSSGIFVGPDEDNLVEAKQRTTEPYGSPPTLKSEEIQIVLTPTWAASGQVYVRQSDPLPLTIVGMTLEVSIGG